MATDPTQRYYRAPCPGCGAPVEFKSAQSTHAVCGYCQSTVVRSGDVLTRLGKMAELFDDHSPLQLFASGRITLDGKEQPFTLWPRLTFTAWCCTPKSRAALARVTLPSVHRMVSGGNKGLSAACTLTALLVCRMRLAVAPARSRAISTGVYSEPLQPASALPPRRRGRRSNPLWPLQETRK